MFTEDEKKNQFAHTVEMFFHTNTISKGRRLSAMEKLGSLVLFTCQYCEKVFSSKSALCFHEKGKHKIKIEEVYSKQSKSIVCQCCAEISTCQQNLEEHI